MIDEIFIQGFKRFKEMRFSISPLTILTGLNGSGKTSIIHALLLAKEASTTRKTSVPLNGPFGLELGTADDVLNKNWTEDILIRVNCSQKGSVSLKLGVPTASKALYLDIKDSLGSLPQAFANDPRSFTYLSAERLGPRTVGATSPLSEADLEVGVKGEFCADVLAAMGGEIYQDETRAHPNYDGKKNRLLKYEVEDWLSEIARPVEVNGERTSDIVAELTFRTPGAEWVRSTNMGFGLTYSLPIILAGLIARKGGIVVIENPEAHLHPAGQSRIGVFLAWLAGSGVQVLVETHSDHVLNGIRRGIAENQYLEASSAVIHYFNESSATGDPLVSTMQFGEEGSISHWPKGFFDQFQIDVAALGKIRRRRQL